MSGNGLSKSDKILTPKHFRQVYESGKRFPSTFFTAFVLPNDAGQCRIGITATRKLGSAVERNRSKRLLREVFRHHKRDLSHGFDIVLNVRRQLLSCSSQELQEEFLNLLRRINQQWLQS